jgi:hypothetical protein
LALVRPKSEIQIQLTAFRLSFLRFMHCSTWQLTERSNQIQIRFCPAQNGIQKKKMQGTLPEISSITLRLELGQYSLVSVSPAS